MIDLKTLVTYAAVVLGLFLIPGPAVLMTVGRAASGGRRVGVATGLGVATGDLGHAAMATFGPCGRATCNPRATLCLHECHLHIPHRAGCRSLRSPDLTSSRYRQMAGQGSRLDLPCPGRSTGAAGTVTRRRDCRFTRQARLKPPAEPLFERAI